MTKTKDNIDAFLEENESTKPVQDSTLPPPTPPVVTPTYKRKEKRQLPASLEISKRCLPPLTRHRRAVYELLGGDRQDLRIIGGEDQNENPINVPRVIEHPPFEFSPTYQFEDRGEDDLGKRRKTMVFTDDGITYNKAKQMSPKEWASLELDIPTFVHGQLVLDCEANYIKYVWMELHPQNQSNKWRDKTRRAEFKRVDIEYVSPHVHLMKMDLAADAEDLVRRMDAKSLTNLASAFGLSMGLSISDMRLDLRQKARTSPEEVLFKTPDKSMANMLNVMHGINMGIVDFNPDTQEYLMGDDTEPFFIVPLDTKNPLEAVGAFLSTPEGKEAMTELEDLLAYWK